MSFQLSARNAQPLVSVLTSTDTTIVVINRSAHSFFDLSLSEPLHSDKKPPVYDFNVVVAVEERRAKAEISGIIWISSKEGFKWHK